MEKIFKFNLIEEFPETFYPVENYFLIAYAINDKKSFEEVSKIHHDLGLRMGWHENKFIGIVCGNKTFG